MTQYLKGAAKRLTFSLVVLSALSGCAVYGPAPVPYAYGTDANGQVVYAAPPVYAAPAYIGPPVFFNFGFWGGGRGGRGGGHGHGGGGHGGGGHGGGHR
nr:hypothetical protein [Polaromonas sp. OV174]